MLPIQPTLTTYQDLSPQQDFVPLFAQILGDGLTPVMVYQKLRELSPYSYLLESVQQNEKLGRFSLVGVDYCLKISSQGEQITMERPNEPIKTQQGNPFRLIMELTEQIKIAQPEGLDHYKGSLVGYFGYDCIRHIERIPDQNPDPLELPESLFILPRRLVIFDNLSQSVTLIELAKAGSEANYLQAKTGLEELAATLAEPWSPAVTPLPQKQAAADFRSNMSEADYCKMVEQGKHYIKEGDIFQVVLSQRFETDYPGDSFEIYRSLRRVNPSPYLFYLHYPDFSIAGSSPEILVKKEGPTLTLRPIAGTRKRGVNKEEDLALQKELLADPKEVAEHMMLVDLGRNDLGRVCRFGSVRPTHFKFVENYSHVMHIVTNLEGQIAPGMDNHAVLMSSFPAGTLTGAPKIRAMEIIDELEVSRRGFYGGTVVALDFNGDFDSCIGIRSVVIQDQKAFVQAGAGIVADSVPAAEYQECLSKARAVFTAIAQAQEKQ